MNRLDHAEAVAALREGGVVAVPTDTVYGVAARLTDPAALARLFAVKRRPLDVALPVLVGSLADLENLKVRWSASASALAARFWPGALTIVVAADPAVASLVGATHSLGLRWPRHPMLQRLLEECGPLAVTSANEHGEPPCTTAEAVRAASWGSPVTGVLDGGRCDEPVSSVVELDTRGWHLRRAGALGRDQLEEVLGPESAQGDG